MKTVTVEQIVVGFCGEIQSPWKEHPEWSCCRASGSVSYVCTEADEGVDVLFDLGSPWNRKEVEEGVNLRLQKNIDNGWTRKKLFVVVSHVHTDHIGNLDLVDDYRRNPCFNEVHIICGQTMQGDIELSEEIRVVETPGHTDHDVSVIVNSSNLGKVAIAGDAFESRADMKDSTLWQAVSLYPEEQGKSRVKLLHTEKVEFVIPGHGPGFRVNSDEVVEDHEVPAAATKLISLNLPSAEAVGRLICKSDETADEVTIVEVGDRKILLNCGPQVKELMNEEERSQVDFVVVSGSFMNAYCLGHFVGAQIVLGRDLAAPDSIYTGDHITDDVFGIGEVLKLEFTDKNVTTRLHTVGDEKITKTHICGFK